VTADGLLDRLMLVVAERQQERDRRTAGLWYALTPRERALVREAAVMGFVHGAMSKPGPPPDPFPGDMAIVSTVIEGAAWLADRYPTLARYVPEPDEEDAP
jgi:hypothetical protein